MKTVTSPQSSCTPRQKPQDIYTINHKNHTNDKKTLRTLGTKAYALTIFSVVPYRIPFIR